MIATFNWDPFLWQALNRNAHKCRMPRALFLHGNTAIGYTDDGARILVGSLGRVSQKCGKTFEPGPLLFPMAKKNYQRDERIRRAWDDLKAAYVVTIFDYSAPVTDVEAIDLLKEGWGDKYGRKIEEFEVIDVKDAESLFQTWKPFIYSHHYRTTKSFENSIFGCSPRRSCEALWAQLTECIFIKRNHAPYRGRWDEVDAFYGDFLDEERLNA